MRLKDKRIIVTAAAQGIGRATALAFQKEGAEVIATDINLKKLEELKSENTNIKIQHLDSTNKEDVEKFAKMANVDVVVLDQDNEELGVICKKTFFISVIGIEA